MRGRLLLISLLALILFAANASSTGVRDLAKPFYDLICIVFGTLIPLGAAMLMIAYAGLRWVASREDPEPRHLAKDIIKYVLIGLIVIALARFFVGLVFGADAADLCNIF